MRKAIAAKETEIPTVSIFNLFDKDKINYSFLYFKIFYNFFLFIIYLLTNLLILNICNTVFIKC
jgi:hypothetical protein